MVDDNITRGLRRLNERMENDLIRKRANSTAAKGDRCLKCGITPADGPCSEPQQCDFYSKAVGPSGSH